jgi:hypothetical protein
VRLNTPLAARSEGSTLTGWEPFVQRAGPLVAILTVVAAALAGLGFDSHIFAAAPTDCGVGPAVVRAGGAEARGRH